ncbi:MobA/MobL family protein [Litoreibacter albidus]|uniref:MobA/MobL family protein n=1 Tax=Litoreibacter albidus TaxID=670155 RepID=A0A1H2T1E4_9RHOB|nr:MobA/MobL family protein [Litoreibacter albidus]
MALFSFRHSVKTFSPKCETKGRVAKAGQTAAHLRYITRPSAARKVLRARFGRDTDQQHASSAEQNALKRKGRACERFIIALPVETTPEQRAELASAFAEVLTQGRASYILAIHDKAGNDVKNPHFHLVAFDIHEKTGTRGRPRSVLGMARKNAVERWAKCWASIHNQKMHEWGFGPECAISPLSFKKQGIDRIPQIHEGPTGRSIIKRKKYPTGKPEWERIDAGRTRAEANRLIREINTLREESKDDPHNRLGSSDRGNPAESGSRCPPFRKDSWGAVPGSYGDRGPVENACQNQHGAAADQQPPWNAGTRSEIKYSSLGSSTKQGDKRPSHTSSNWPDRPPVRRPHIRRLFLELIFLRDTLRVRLANLSSHRTASLQHQTKQHSPQNLTQEKAKTRVRKKARHIETR